MSQPLLVAATDVPTLRETVREQAHEIELLTAALRESRAAGATAVLPDYRRTLDELRLAAASCIPQGSTVAVASRGDEEALQLHGLRAWHFPRTADGAWSAQYPGDGAEAVAQLVAVQGQGAQFLILPWAAFWWLDSYPALAAHLDRYATIVRRDAACVIYQLEGRSASRSGIADAERVTYRHISELLAALTPEGVRVAIYGSPPPPGVQMSRECSLTASADADCAFLVIPDVPMNATAEVDEIRRDAAERFTLVASRKGFGEIYALTVEVAAP